MKERNETFRALTRLHITPKHALGQNFLIDEEVYANVIAEAEITQKTNVLEIGTGIGTLTKKIADHAAHVVTIEHDQALVKKLPEEFADYQNITLVPGSYLDVPHKEIGKLFPNKKNEFIVVANLPYQITAKTLQRLVSDEPVPKRSVVMVQREVAERVTAKPGKYSMLALMVQWHATPEKLFDVSPESFYPPPKVHSSVIRLIPNGKPPASLPKNVLIEDVFRVAKIAFHQKRKKIRNSLPGGLGIADTRIRGVLDSCKIDENSRPQELGHADWVCLVSKIATKKK